MAFKLVYCDFIDGVIFVKSHGYYLEINTLEVKFLMCELIF